MDEELRSKSGRVLTEEDIARLAAEAEAGVDLSTWKPRSLYSPESSSTMTNEEALEIGRHVLAGWQRAEVKAGEKMKLHRMEACAAWTTTITVVTFRGSMSGSSMSCTMKSFSRS